MTFKKHGPKALLGMQGANQVSVKCKAMTLPFEAILSFVAVMLFVFNFVFGK